MAKDPIIGAEVTVFSDPVTRKREEGRAVVLERYDTPDYFRVRFVEDGCECSRFILYL